MPHPFAPVKAGSLAAVYLPDVRCDSLGLGGFKDYEPLIARVVKVLGNDTFECQWLVSQPFRGDHEVDGLADGYSGRWCPWKPFEDEDAPLTVLSADDFYATNFKLTPKSKLSPNLQDVLKKSLDIFKGYADEHAAEREARDVAGVEEEAVDVVPRLNSEVSVELP